jgi:hypothetical protein
MAKIEPPSLKVPEVFIENPETAAFFDSLLRTVYQLWQNVSTAKTKAKTLTTDATPTTLQRIATNDSRSVYIEAIVVARRTGGSSGAVGDTAWYKISGGFKNIAGSIYQIGSTVTDGGEDQAGWGVAFAASGTDIIIVATGAAGNNITWESDVFYNEVGA